MAAYVVAHIEITDAERYADYEAGFLEIFARYDGELVAVDDAPEALEGDLGGRRCVILRFPDKAAARAWYDSSDYRELAAVRWEASTGHAIIADGIG